MSQGSTTVDRGRGWGGWVASVAWGAILLLLVIFLCASWQGPDIFYHLNLGKQVLSTGHPQPPESVLRVQPRYVNIYWLYQIVNQGLFAAGGSIAVSLLTMAVWLGFFVYCARIWRAAACPAMGLPLALASVLVVQGRFDPRPDAVAWLFAAIWLHWLTTWDFSRRLSWRRIAMAGALQVVWTNVHGYFAFGPLLAAALLLAAMFDPDKRDRTVEIAKLLGVVVIGSLITPFGLKAWRFVFDLWRFGGQMRDAVIEVRPPTGAFLSLWTVKLFWVVWGATILLGAALVWKKRMRMFPLLLLLGGLILSARGVRYSPALVLFAAPAWGLLAGARDAAAPSRTRGGRLARGISIAAAIASLTLCAWAVTGGYHRSLSSPARLGITLPADAYPARVAAFMKDNGFRGTIFNDSSDGGYIQYRVPGVRVYMDSRYIEPAIVQDYFAALKRRDRFEAAEKEFHFDGVLLKVSESPELLASLIADPKWKIVYTDLHRAFIVPVDREMPATPLRFYGGEDLEHPADGRAAIEWTVLFARMKNRDMLLRVLDQLDASPKIPSFVIQYALGYGMQSKDAALIAKGRGMYGRMIARTQQDRATVDRLMLMTSRGAGPDGSIPGSANP